MGLSHKIFTSVFHQTSPLGPCFAPQRFVYDFKFEEIFQFEIDAESKTLFSSAIAVTMTLTFPI
jgi:hypothetical protein